MLAPKALALFDPEIRKINKAKKAIDTLQGAAKEEASIKLVKDIMKSQEKINKASEMFSLGYMGLISASDVYNDALQGGYDKRVAGVSALLSSAALFGIMNINASTRGLGTWFLDKTTGFDEEATRAPLLKLMKSEYKNIKTGLDQFDKGNKKNIVKWWSDFKVKNKDVLSDAILIHSAPVWTRMMVEGAEEVTEEIVQDTVKGMVDAIAYLTNIEGSFNTVENTFSKEGLSRYIATALGGAIGGGIFVGQNMFEQKLAELKNPELAKSAQNREVNYQIANAILEGKLNDLHQEADRIGKIFSNSQESNQLFVSDDISAVLGKSGETMSQAITKILHNKIDYINTMITQNVGDFGKLNDFQKHMLANKFASLFTDLNFDNKYLKESWKKTCTDVLNAKMAYDNFVQDHKDGQLTEDQKKIKDELKTDLENSLQHVNEFYSGKEYTKYVLDGEILYNKDWASVFIPKIDANSSEEEKYRAAAIYAQFTKGIIDFDSLPISQKNKIVKELEDIKPLDKDENWLETIPRIRELIMAVTKSISPQLNKFAQNEHAKELLKWCNDSDNQNKIQDQLIQELVEKLNNEEITEAQYNAKINQIKQSFELFPMLELLKNNPDTWDLSSRSKYDLFDKIKDILDLSAFNEEQQKYLQVLFNDIAVSSRITRWNKDNLELLVDSVNKALSDESNPYTQKISELEQDQKQSSTLNVYNKNLGIDTSKITKDIEFEKITSLTDYANKLGNDIDEFKKYITRKHTK